MGFVDTAESGARTRMRLMKDTFLSNATSKYDDHIGYQDYDHLSTRSAKRIPR